MGSFLDSAGLRVLVSDSGCDDQALVCRQDECGVREERFSYDLEVLIELINIHAAAVGVQEHGDVIASKRRNKIRISVDDRG